MLKKLATREVVPAGGRYELALNIRRGRGVFALRPDPRGLVVRLSQGTRDEAGRWRILLTVFGEPETTDEDLELAFAAGMRVGGLADDPGDFADRVADHPVLGPLADRFRGARITRTATVFPAFATSVIEQLVTWYEASGSIRRLWAKFGGRIQALGLRTPPDPERLAASAPFELRPLGISLKRASTLLYGAKHAAALERLRELPIDEAKRRLRAMPGVGVWTTNMVAMKALGHADAVLVGDAGAPFVTTMALSGTAGGDHEMLKLLEPFRPDRARVHQLLELAQRIDHAVPGVPPRQLPRVDPHRREPWRY